MSQRVDVVIVGAGPAGIAAALTLRRHGASVLVADRSLARPTLGEGLAPSASPILQDLGLWERFNADTHQPAYGNRSAWGSPDVRERDFIRNPYGHGWHLDRPRFDVMLGAALQDAGGAMCSDTRVVAWHRDRRGAWTLELLSGGTRRVVRTDFLIDATGRARSLSRALGATRRLDDHLVAAVGVLYPGAAGSDTDSFTQVEAVPDGWWYATLLGDGRLIAGYLTDADDAGARASRTIPGWTALLDRTAHLRDRIARHGYRLRSPLHVAAADSSSLETMGGDGWCAVGDAAAAHDPLSSHGIAGALLSGIWAGNVIAARERGGLNEYQERMRHAYAAYLAQWLAYYDLERRWPTSPFWQRRHAALASLVPFHDVLAAPSA